jgi:hypothetical protein
MVFTTASAALRPFPSNSMPWTNPVASRLLASHGRPSRQDHLRHAFRRTVSAFVWMARSTRATLISSEVSPAFRHNRPTMIGLVQAQCCF